MKVKIVAYNIFRGLHSKIKTEGPVEEDLARVNAAKSVIADLRPDILMITEACLPNYNNHNFHLNYRKLFGLKYQVDRGPISDSLHGNLILSRFPIEQKEDCTAPKNKHARAIVNITDKKLMLDLVHPSVHISEEERANFLSKVMQEPMDSRILAGDFNAYSPEDTYDEERIVASYQKFLKEPEKARPFVTDLLTKKAIQTVKNAGFIDTYRIFHKRIQQRTVPTQLRIGGDEGARMDYIFCSPDVKVVNAGIYTSNLTMEASDHFPVWATLEI